MPLASAASAARRTTPGETGLPASIAAAVASATRPTPISRSASPPSARGHTVSASSGAATTAASERAKLANVAGARPPAAAAAQLATPASVSMRVMAKRRLVIAAPSRTG